MIASALGAEAIIRTRETTPPDATHRSTRRMAAAPALRDPLVIERVRDVVGRHLDPPGRSVVQCVDDRTRIQDLDRTPGVPGRAVHDYRRAATSGLLARSGTKTADQSFDPLAAYRYRDTTLNTRRDSFAVSGPLG